MADPTGFLKHSRQLPPRRPVEVRIQDWREVYESADPTLVRTQAGRCMDCGIPFCHNGCPLGNLIPDWNELVRTDDWAGASERLHATNNFPEFTGALRPAPCEAACVLALSDEAVTIKQVEFEISERAWQDDLVSPQLAQEQTGRRVSVVGSGPAGLAAAQQLTRAGHTVTVYERDDRLGGLMRYGIPDFKMAKSRLDRRLDQMRSEGTRFVTSCEVGVNLSVDELSTSSDAVVLCIGALQPRELTVPGSDLEGVYPAMVYLTAANRSQLGEVPDERFDARGRHVVIIGGGDTGADCLGTAHRQGAASVVQLDLHPQPPATRHPSTPWPSWPLVYKESPAHEEGGLRRFAVRTERFLPGPSGRLSTLVLRELLDSTPAGRSVVDGKVGDPFELPCDLVLVATGFTGPEPMELVERLGVERDERTRLRCGPAWETSAPGVFVAGDAHRGASLVVWAIAEGRSAAAAVDRHLMGETNLPSPLRP